MPEPTGESKKRFGDVIEKGRRYTPQEAIELLCTFHGATPESVVKAFMRLKDFNEGIVVFRESVQSGHPIIVMEGQDDTEQIRWSHYIDKHTGQPLSRTS